MQASILEMIKPLYGVEIMQGYTEEDIALLKEMFGTLPQVLEDYYRTAGRTETFHYVQDMWMLPEQFKKWEWLQKSECLILLNENQGVCRAGIRREDLCLPDPPVYVTDDDKNWILCSPAVSRFLPAALAFEAVLGFEYSPEEFYWLNGQEVEGMEAKLTKFPFELENWIGMRITLYGNAPDNMAAVMDCGDGEPQMFYGAASEASYKELMNVLEGMGEPV